MLSIQEICQITGKSEKTIYRLMNDGKLPYKTIGNKRYSEHNDVANNLRINTQVSEEIGLSKKIDTLTAEIARLSTLVESLIPSLPTANDSQRQTNDNQRLSGILIKPEDKITKKTPSSSNEIRAEKSKMQLFEALDKLNKSHNIPMYREKPSITGIHKITGIDRGTISKYIEEWIINNQIEKI